MLASVSESPSVFFFLSLIQTLGVNPNLSVGHTFYMTHQPKLAEESDGLDTPMPDSFIENIHPSPATGQACVRNEE